MSVGNNIRRLRENKKIQQKFLAEKAGITQSMLSQIEKGIKNPSLQVGKEIADILGCKMEDLLAEDTKQVV